MLGKLKIKRIANLIIVSIGKKAVLQPRKLLVLFLLYIEMLFNECRVFRKCVAIVYSLRQRVATKKPNRMGSGIFKD